MKPTWPGRSPARDAQRLAVVGTVVLALLPAALALWMGWMTEQQRALASARATAWIVERQAPALGVAGLAARPELQHGLDAEEARDLFGPDGRALASGGNPQARAWPATVTVAELRQAGRRVGSVQVARSLRPTWVRAAALALAGSLLAMLLWLAVLKRPIGRLHRSERLLHGLAHSDALTGLHNLAGLRHRVQRALHHGGQGLTAVLVIDLDRFRTVNASLGHAGGDRLLCSVAERMRAVTRPADVVARLGGDRFGILVQGIAGPAAASAIARNLLRAMTPPYDLAGGETVLGLSIGVAVAGADIASADALLLQADAAMHAAKLGGGGRYKVYESSMDANRRQLALEAGLRRALQHEELSLAYQPIVSVAGRHTVGVEALLRWSNPQLGTVPPSDFIPVLESSGLIVEAGRWVLRQACHRALRWTGAGPEPLLLSVNVSPRQFAEPDFVDMVEQVLTETGLPPQRLQLEITEGLLLDPTMDAMAKIDALALQGVRFAIDDFGTGYSSLAYLKRFRLHSLKIDQVFVREVASAPQDQVIVRAIIDLGHGLGLHLTAEGVETEAQLDALRRLGCDACQGYLFAAPLPEARFDEHWAAGRADHSMSAATAAASSASIPAAVAVHAAAEAAPI